MTDLTGRSVELSLPEDGPDREKVRGALFQNGDRGRVLRAHRRWENAWIVVMHERVVMFFTDELKEIPMICKPCGNQQHEQCAAPVSCPCLHRVFDEPVEEPSSSENVGHPE